MNDLERDLRELFRNQAASVDAPTLAPEPVLLRSRRRQVRTVVGGAAATAIVLAAAVVALGTLRNPTASVPSSPTGYAERTATIDGIRVTAPAGWTLIDDSPMARILPASSESCSFSATGVPVAGPGAADPSQVGSEGSGGTVTEPSQSCSRSPVAQAAGIPILQLSNVELPPIGFVCDVTGIDRTSFPSDGVAAYVAQFPNGLSTGEFDRSCPGTEEIQTFADERASTVYAAVTVVGPDASADDAAVVRDFVRGLGGIRIVPSEPSTAGGPAYVVAAGVDGGTPWRIEAGITALGSSDAPIGAMLVTTGTDGHETSSASLPSGGIVEQDSQFADGTWLQWGTAPASVTDITSVAPDGTRTEANLVPWPDGLRSFTDPTTLDGVIWEVHVAEQGTLETVGSTTSVSGQVTERGDVVASSSTGEVSWRLGWTASNCLELDVTSQLPGDAGNSGCIIPFDGSDPFIGGFYGQDNAVIAVVGPSGMMAINNANCLDPMGSDGAWGGTSVCVLVIPVGSEVTIGVRDANGTLVNGIVTVQALPGRLHLVERGVSSPAAP